MTLDEAVVYLTRALARFEATLDPGARGVARAATALAQLRGELGAPVGSGARWEAWHSLTRCCQVDRTWSEEAAAAWRVVEGAGDEAVLSLLSGRIDPVFLANLLLCAWGDDALELYCGLLRLPCSRDVALLLTLRAVEALGRHPVVWALKLPAAEFDEGAVVGVAATLANVLAGRAVGDLAVADPVDLAWGALRYLYMVVGNAETPGRSLLLRAFVRRSAERLAALADTGVALFPDPIRGWTRTTLPERLALLGVAAELAGPEAARRLDADLVGEIVWLLTRPAHDIPGDPTSGWDLLFTDACAGLLVRQRDRGERETWWDAAIARAAEEPPAWRAEVVACQLQAVRGAWLTWVALGACRRMAGAGSEHLEDLRTRTTTVLAASRRWLWETPSLASPMLVHIPMVVLELAMLAPTEDLDHTVDILLPFIAEPAIARGMAEQLAGPRPDLAAKLRERLAEIESYQAAMSD